MLLSDKTMRERSKKSSFFFDADGATAPETLRHQDRIVRTIWRETLSCVHRRGYLAAFRRAVGSSSQVPVTDGALISL